MRIRGDSHGPWDDSVTGSAVCSWVDKSHCSINDLREFAACCDGWLNPTFQGLNMNSFLKNMQQGSGKAVPFSSLVALGVTGALAAASGSAGASTTPVTKAPATDIGERVAAIRERLADPDTASGMAKRLRIDRRDGLVQFANFNNWDNGWNNQGFNNY
jgi:hypothetical protein